MQSRRSLFLIRRRTRFLPHQVRWLELKRSEWLVILWVANASTIPTAVVDSVGQVEWQPIATIRKKRFVVVADSPGCCRIDEPMPPTLPSGFFLALEIAARPRATRRVEPCCNLGGYALRRLLVHHSKLVVLDLNEFSHEMQCALSPAAPTHVAVVRDGIAQNIVGHSTAVWHIARCSPNSRGSHKGSGFSCPVDALRGRTHFGPSQT